jgi:AcrR family transcriptional regulator
MTRHGRPGRPSNREHVLAAATHVALRDGPGAVTIDAVVAESGMSRGGVLYHFPSKDALLQALVDQDIDAVRAVTGLDGAASVGSPTERIRAYYDACTAWAPERGHVALAVALAENPGLLRSWAQVQRDLDAADAVTDTSTDTDATGTTGPGEPGRDPDARPALATLVARLALDGLWFSDLIDPHRFTAAERERVVEAIITGAQSARRAEPAGSAEPAEKAVPAQTAGPS